MPQARRVPVRPFPWPRLGAIAAAGGACAILVLIAGWTTTRVIVGGDLPQSRERVQAEVSETISRAADRLRTRAASFEPAAVESALRGDEASVRTLFDRAASSLSGDVDDTSAVSVFDATGTPIAWAGRPSELPAERLTGPRSWFLAQGALGVRLVFVSPLNGAGGRLGSVATEETLELTSATVGDAGELVLASNTPVRIEPAFENGQTVADPGRFEVADPDGGPLLVASVADADLARTERRWNRAARSAALSVIAVTMVLCCGPVLGWRRRGAGVRGETVGLGFCALAVLGGRILLRVASPADFTSAEVFSGAAYASPLAAPFLSSPFDFLSSAMACAALLILALIALDGMRLRRHRRRRPLLSLRASILYAAGHIIAGTLALGVLVLQTALVADTIANSGLDLLHFSLHPWNAARLALQVGLALWHVTAGAALVGLFRAALMPWSFGSRQRGARTVAIALWIVPGLVWGAATRSQALAALPLLLSAAAIAGSLPQLLARYRHASQAFRLLVVTSAIVLPALASYPVVLSLNSSAKRDLVETRFGPQALNQRQTIQRLLQESLAEIDGLPALADLVATPVSPDDGEASTERAFQLWRNTGLASYPITSSVELFGANGRLLSRFAFNLPDDLTTTPTADEDQCGWTVYEEVSPFFAEERRVLHAGRALCAPDAGGVQTPHIVGAIVVHALLDYANLPFIASQSPYVELLRPGNPAEDESQSGRDLEYAVYGWSGRAVYTSSGTAWPIDSDVLRRAALSRAPFWTTLRHDTDTFNVYVLNDRGGIYALGFPRLSALWHLVNMAEIAVLGSVVCLLVLLVTVALDLAGGQATSGRALFMEIRVSFYRKLFLAFVAASAVPVVTLALLTRNYIAGELRAGVEQEAVRTVAAAKRVVEDLVIPQTASAREGVDDNLMVWVSRLIDQDVNVFRGARLLATSERNLFASGVLGNRTPADVYRAVVLQRDATVIVNDRIGTLGFIVAAAPLTTRQFDGMLTVPLTLRQQDIEAQIDTLNRLVLLGAVLFILAGAGIGYSMAERIADPVSRLTRATRRIARGELDVRIAATSSDELRRLVQDFNTMAEDLQRQRGELERTHRLEAWAEMARQVAHEIKNPLTPIQLNAEHLRRVHADRGQPLSPVLEECVSNILKQVSILRTIASEFSNFASNPTVQRARLSLHQLVSGLMVPYETALRDTVSFHVDVPADLPPVFVDRTLLTRAITNIVENALHAMPGGGVLRITAARAEGGVELRMADTGVGMDAEALSRAFEPYFSTKITGTGLGLPIAKRNVELSGGTLTIESTVGQGTTLRLMLPID